MLISGGSARGLAASCCVALIAGFEATYSNPLKEELDTVQVLIQRKSQLVRSRTLIFPDSGVGCNKALLFSTSGEGG